MQTHDHHRTALVLLDRQKGILRVSLAPHVAPRVIGHAAALAKRFRALRALAVLVDVGWSADIWGALS